MRRHFLVNFALCFFSLYGWAQKDGQLGNSHRTYYTLSDFGCSVDAVDCYEKIRDGLNKREIELSGSPIGYPSKEGYSAYKLGRHKTEKVIVYIHGLWGNSSQYDRIDNLIKLQSFYDKSERSNAIFLTLPGHFSQAKWVKERDKKIVRKVHFRDWIQALDETVLLASKLGNKVVLVGQSTGGLLSVMGSFRFPEVVKGLVLTEPALQVKGHLKFASCDMSGLLSVFNSIAGKPIDGKLSMGCQVALMVKEFLGAYEGSKAEDQIQSMARSIRVPVLLLNNEEDDVVEAKANQLFYDQLQVEKQYVSLTEFLPGVDHGTSEFYQPQMMAEKIGQFLK